MKKYTIIIMSIIGMIIGKVYGFNSKVTNNPMRFTTSVLNARYKSTLKTNPIQDSLILEPNYAPPGNPVDLTLKLFNVDIVSGIQVTITFDTTKLHYNNVTLDSTLTNFTLSANRKADSVFVVIISLSGDSINPTPGPDGQTLFKINFLVDSSATLGDSTYVNLVGGVLSDPLANQLDVYQEGAWVYVRGTKGDLNQDGVVNVADVVREINIILSKPPAPSNYELWAGDVNGDGNINVADVVATINIILGRGKKSPISDSYKVSVFVEQHKVILNNDIKLGGIQFDLIGNALDIQTTNRTKNIEMFVSAIPGGKRVVLVDLEGRGIEEGNGGIIMYKGCADLRNIAVSDIYGNKVKINTSRKLYAHILEGNILFRKSLTLSIFSLTPSIATVKIIDLSGRTVVKRRKALTIGYNKIRLYSKDLKNGVYFIDIESDGYEVVKRFILEK